MLDLLAGFVQELRRAGIPVSLTENLDAMEAVKHIPIEDREAFKFALAATLVKSAAHWKAFETVFEVYFSFRGREYRIGEEADLEGMDPDDLAAQLQEMAAHLDRGHHHGLESLTPEEMAALVEQAILDADEVMMRALASAAVRRFAGMEPGRPVGGTYYLYRTLRNLDLDGVLDRLMQQAREDACQPLTPLEERLERDEYEARIDQLRKEIEAEIRRRLVADR